LLWFHNLALGLLPKFVLDIAREAHSDEALLATLAIVIWHWYNAHFNPTVFPMNTTIFTGKISKERMLKEHSLEYEQLLKAQEATAPAAVEAPTPVQEQSKKEEAEGS